MTFVPSTGVGWGRDGVRGASARRASATVLAAAVLSALLFAVGGAARPDAAAAAQDKIIIFQGAYLDGFRRWDGAAAERLFSNRRTYLIVDQNYPRIPLGWDARPTLMFKYLRDFKQAVEQDLIPPEVEAVIYNAEPQLPDPETPPEPFADEFARVAHSLGLTYIAAPGGCVAPTPANPDGCPGTFLRAGARGADIVDLQIQRSQSNPDEYVWRLERAIERVRAVNPTARIVTQTTSNPAYVSPDLGVGPTISSLVRAAPYVDGFWPYILPDSCPQPCELTESSRNGYQLLSAIDELGLAATAPEPPAAVGTTSPPVSAPAISSATSASLRPRSRPRRRDTSVDFQLSARRSQRALKQKGLVVFVRCPERCTAAVAATISSPKIAKRLQLKRHTKALPRGQRAKFTLRLSRRQLERLARALRSRSPRVKATATVSVSVADASRNRKRRTVTIRLTS